MKADKFYLLFILFLVFTVYIVSPVMISSDSRWCVFTAMSIIKEGNIDLDEYRQITLREPRHIIIKNGHLYHYYSLGPALVAVPFVYLIDKIFESKFVKNVYFSGFVKTNMKQYIRKKYIAEFPRFKKYLSRFYPQKPDISLEKAIDIFPLTVLTLSPLIEKFIASFLLAVCAALIFLMARLWLNQKESLCISLIFSFCTSAWSVASRGLYAHGPNILMLTIALYIILLAKQKQKFIRFSIFPMILSYLIRPNIAIILLTIYILIYYRQHALYFILVWLAVLSAYCLHCLIIYKSILPPYYYGEAHKLLSGKLFLNAFLGNIISPARGIFIYCPVFIFSVWGAVSKTRQKPIDRLDIFLIIALILHWTLFSAYRDWQSGWSFGQRYFADMLPLFIYFLICFVSYRLRANTKSNSLVFAAFIVAIVISFLINFRGATRIETWLWNKFPSQISNNSIRLWDWGDLPFFR
ncbi:MAG: hypothetical protein WC628_03970 [Candidatus Omnitrophota bacterium]